MKFKIEIGKESIIIIIENDVEFGRKKKRKKEHEIKNRMSENQKTILNIKKTKAKNQNNLFCNWQTYTWHTHTYIYGTRNYIYYIVLYLAFYSSNENKKKERKETLLLCKTMCENNLKVIIYIYIYILYM